MENTQNRTPFSPRQGFQGQGFQGQPFPGSPWGRPPQMTQPTQSLAQPRPMSQSARLEALRNEMIERFSQHGLAGFQVVRREFMSHSFDPAMTIRENSVTFNNSCISKLENASYVQIMIHTDIMKLVIRPCEEGDRDAVRWCVTKDDKRKSRQIMCREFTGRLFDFMGWETIYRYKLLGVDVDYMGEKVYVFDFQSKEAFPPSYKDPETGKIVRPRPILPEEWNGSFGMTVEEHEASTKIDLSQGFMGMGDLVGADNSIAPEESTAQEDNTAQQDGMIQPNGAVQEEAQYE